MFKEGERVRLKREYNNGSHSQWVREADTLIVVSSTSVGPLTVLVVDTSRTTDEVMYAIHLEYTEEQLELFRRELEEMKRDV